MWMAYGEIRHLLQYLISSETQAARILMETLTAMKRFANCFRQAAHPVVEEAHPAEEVRPVRQATEEIHPAV